MRKLAAIIIGLAFGLCAVQAMARNGQYLFREMARYQVPSGAAPALTASLLLHFDEANGSTNIVDSGKYGLSVTSVFGAQTTNNPIKFGNVFTTAEGAVSRHFDVAWTNDFSPGTNNWSIDLWIRADAFSVASNVVAYLFGDPTTALRNFIYVRKNNNANYRIDLSTNGNASWSAIQWPIVIDAISNQWMHLAIWRLNTGLYIATNGSLVNVGGAATNLGTASFTPTNTSPFVVGAGSLGSRSIGYIEEFRYCLGSAMPYGTTNFTPPTAPYTGYE